MADIKTNLASIGDIFALYNEGDQADSIWKEISGVISPINENANLQILGENIVLMSDLNALATKEELNTKQDTLVNQVNLKSVGGITLLGAGNIAFPNDVNWNSNGTALKDLSMGTFKLRQDALPTNNFDVSNKRYVDEQISGITPPADPNWNSNGTAIRTLNMGGFRLLNVGPAAVSTDATNKGYVDGRTPFGNNGTSTKNLSMGTFKLTQSTAPTTANDVTNKTYVDSFWSFNGTAGSTTAYVRPNRDGTTTANWQIRYIKDPTTADAVATKGYVDNMPKTLNFPELKTNAKTIIGAINELEELIK